MNAKKEYVVTNLHCTDCAIKLEGTISQMDGAHGVSLNFMKKKLMVEILDEKTA